MRSQRTRPRALHPVKKEKDVLGGECRCGTLALVKRVLLALIGWWGVGGTGAVHGQGPADQKAETGVPLVEHTLRSGAASLVVGVGQPVRIVVVGGPTEARMEAEAAAPLRVGVLNKAGETRWLEGTYGSVTEASPGVRGVGEVRTPAGSVFRFADLYTPAPVPGGFVLTRGVSVAASAPDDVGFMTRFALRWPTPTALRDCEGFLPGVWYLDNQAVPPHALAANLDDARIWVREDRLALPLMTLRRKADGVALTLVHLHPDGGTCPGDERPGPLVDARLQFAALGVSVPAQPEVSLVYPGTEGERTYLHPPRQRPPAGGATRFHPVRADVRHAYQIMFSLDRDAGFPLAMRRAWRAAYALAQPVVARVNAPAVYEASLHLLGNESKDYNGVPGVPFKLPLPSGGPAGNGDVSYQMGFVGQQLPLAYHLLRYGWKTHQEDFVKKGEKTLDFWSRESLTAEGLPRTWYEPFPRPHWRDYHTFLRVASDGMMGALQAWVLARHERKEHPEWLKFCRGYGDWLLAHQNADGSWAREWDFASHPVNESKMNTTHPIAFLVDLAAATGERRYAEAAVRAGEWCLPNVHEAFAYVGGTADNPNVVDKEAGFMALQAFLALHDLTGEARWLPAAAQAADFMETWTYAWSVPPAPGEPPPGALPPRLLTSGFSLIATGHSAADLFLAGAPFFYYRLYVETGDVHYLAVARLLYDNTRQFVDVDGSMGYGQPGLCTEALTLATPRGQGVNVWLPWLTASVVEPMTRLEDVFGTMNLEAAAGAGLGESRTRDARYAQERAAVWRGGQ